MAKNSLAKAMLRIAELEKELLAKNRKYEALLKKYEEAIIDPLTELPRRELIKQRHRILIGVNKRRFKSGPKPITLVMFDVDYFKQVNDTYGHAVGDTVLREVAQGLNTSIRPDDVLVRFAGEEFAALLMDIPDEKSAYAFVDRIRSIVNTTCFLPNKKAVAISAGVFVDKSGSLSFEKLFEKADQNLYVAKNSGRNCVISSAT